MSFLSEVERTLPFLGQRPSKKAVSFLNSEEVLAFPQRKGDCRYPYGEDGLLLWACSSGYLYSVESSFNLFCKKEEGKEPVLCFYGGKKKDGSYDPVSLTGVGKRKFVDGGDRATLFTPTHATYFVRKDGILYALRAFVGKDKALYFSLLSKNEGQKKEDVELVSYFNPLLCHGGESDESKWFKKSALQKDGFLFTTVEDVSREIHLHHKGDLVRLTSKPCQIKSTTSRTDWSYGKQEYIAVSPALDTGEFLEQKTVTSFSDTAIAGDIASFSLEPGEAFLLHYRFSIHGDRIPLQEEEIEDQLRKKQKENDEVYRSKTKLEIHFEESGENQKEIASFNSFLPFLEKQVRYGALAKDSSGSLLGVRDVAQMIEGALIYDPAHCREKIKEVLSFEYQNGRFPRQYSLPSGDEDPHIDDRAFIDQGQWVLSMVHSYLSFTGDLSLLDEVCGFYLSLGSKAHKVEETSSLYDHLKRALDYLLSNLDPDSGCLHILYGDWNDAVDGLGHSSDPSSPFGNGVSAMATFHLVKNLLEMSEIASALGERDYAESLLKKREKLILDANQTLLQRKGREIRILHGYGENASFYVGSFHDVDSKDRVGVASNAYYVIGGLFDGDPSIKESILSAYSRLDSKYGLLTFEPGFGQEASAVGRIVNLPIGTAENGSVYVHASMFGVSSLFQLNEPEFAYRQLSKLLPLNHEFVSTTPFVMPNSYIHEDSIQVDGESMSDWYTGSSNTLLKLLVKDLFGFCPKPDGTLSFHPARVFPSDKATMKLYYRTKPIEVSYENSHSGKRIIKVDGRPIPLAPNVSGILGFEEKLVVEKSIEILD